jgi:hypothetical protein
VFSAQEATSLPSFVSRPARTSSHTSPLTTLISLRAEKTVAQPAASVTLVGTDLASIEACEHARLLRSGVKAQVPSVGELGDTDALLRWGEVSLAAASGSTDSGSGARAVC